ncbi:DLW-39 family protein [Jatrophihabitans sp. DSM 45814]
MKKLLALAAAVGAVVVVKRKKDRQSSDVWHNATRPS